MTAKRPVGRPALFDTATERKTVHLPPKIVKQATKAGNGSLSRGIVSAFSKQAQKGRQHRFVAVTDPDEIEAIKRNQWGDPDGGLFDGIWVAEARSLMAYRKKVAESLGNASENA